MAEDSEAALRSVLLHGDLDLWIHEARRLPNMDMFSERFRRCCAPCSSLLHRGSADHRRHSHRKIITSDPYVTVNLAGATLARTRVIPNSQNPVWNEHFKLPLAHHADRLLLNVKDDDVFGAQLIGRVTVPAASIVAGGIDRELFPVLGSNGKPPKPDTALLISAKFTPMSETTECRNGIAGDPEKKGVRNTYFPLRKGGMVTLYRDAHVGEGELPEINLGKGRFFGHEKCWEDICHAILEAHHLIYIVGWSVYCKVKLVREPIRPLPSAGELTLGELLKYKSQEGVRVCLLVWDDKTSHDKLLLKTSGVMATHDEETRKFFKHSSVMCVLAPRYASSKLSIVKQQVVGTLFTHHQKCVLVDTQASGNNRKITAFIGGLDLCDGRYDTPEHRLFRDLDTVFLDDFHNPTFVNETKGPRQPWHDLHCKIEGPAAYDVLTNFEQRWRKSTKLRSWRFKKKPSRWNDDALIKLERISWILSPSPKVKNDDPILWVTDEEDTESWHVQVFRSIDSGSLKGFPKTAQESVEKGLIIQKNIMVDKSIHTAYVKAIRSAQHFIYIENQYFIGSSYAWLSYKNAGADNLIPMELALKIASKIKAQERFSVYIVIPMWPEGVPSTASVQEILFWQSQTMEMMYNVIAQQLRDMRLEAHPQDYLNFFCLGNREELPKNGEQLIDELAETGGAASSRKFRRFMIYVHAKGMIVDDEYVIVGSANINERSLAGSRDTEIAMGACQPHHTWARQDKHPRGQVYGYRMSLWAEHLGKVDKRFKSPESLDCVRLVNQIAEDNWKRYTADKARPLEGHLLKYPIKVEADGKIGPIPGQESFPDVGGKILGSPTSLPDSLTA
ncbi:Phospholipase D delta [Apostasia shenzhenica]|uniref:Phospholipase D n=1 Tax=Apostasia shenzhenica TaxID=1088818 RepID=A0A2I0AJE1_9ASPA|nr:Phospholipase D delta [Apostasia shenzhenica]